jgi:thioredoxin reductase
MGPAAGVNYFVQNIDAFTNKNVVIARRGDAAFDWVRALAGVAKSIFLVHSRDLFRAHVASLETLSEVAKSKKIHLYVPFQLTGLIGYQKSLYTVQVEYFNGNSTDLNADVLMAYYGLSKKLDPIVKWGLEIENRRIETNPTTAKINQPGLLPFAILPYTPINKG